MGTKANWLDSASLPCSFQPRNDIMASLSISYFSMEVEGGREAESFFFLLHMFPLVPIPSEAIKRGGGRKGTFIISHQKTIIELTRRENLRGGA